MSSLGSLFLSTFLLELLRKRLREKAKALESALSGILSYNNLILYSSYILALFILVCFENGLCPDSRTELCSGLIIAVNTANISARFSILFL